MNQLRLDGFGDESSRVEGTTFGNMHGDNGKDEWLTPPELIAALGEFDLDPCSPINRPWPTAKKHLTVEDNGLTHRWDGRVWLNPPYGDQTFLWMEKLADHGNGIALIFARTETAGFFDQVWSRADAILFIRGRISFCHVNGNRARTNAGAPSCLVAYGMNNAVELHNCAIDGKFVRLGR